MNKKIIAVFFILAALGGVAFVAAFTGPWAVDLGQVTVNPAPTIADVAITRASFNGNTGTITPEGQTVTFADSSMTIGDTTSLSITVLNSGETTATLTTPTISVAPGVLTFTPTNLPSTCAASGTSTFTWTVTAINVGVVNPSVTINWS